MMRKLLQKHFILVGICSVLLLTGASLFAQAPGGEPMGPPMAPFGLPMQLSLMPGDSIDLPVEFFEQVPADSQLSALALTLASNSPDFLFHYVDTAKTKLTGWTVSYAPGDDSIRIEVTAPAGTYFVHLDTMPALLYSVVSSLSPEATEGDSILLTMQHVSLTVHGNTIVLEDSLFVPTVIHIGKNDPSPEPEGHLFAFSETEAAPDSDFAINLMLIEPVPVDSQLSRIRLTIKTMPAEVDWASEGHILSAELSGWTLTVTPNNSSVEVDLQAPGGTYLSHDGGDPFTLFSLAGMVKSTVPPESVIDVFAEQLFLTISGIEMPGDSMMVHPGKIMIGSGQEPPPPPPGEGAPFALMDINAKPGDDFNIDFAAIQPIPPDSQLSRISLVLRAMPPELEWATEGHQLSTDLAGWSFTVTPGGDSVEVDLQAPEGVYLLHDSNDPFVLFSLNGTIKPSTTANFIEIRAQKVTLTLAGVEKPEDPMLVEPGKIQLDNGNGPPSPGDEGSLFSFFDVNVKPDSNFFIGFALNVPVPVDSQLSRIQIAIIADPPYVQWVPDSSQVGMDFPDWTITSYLSGDTMFFDLQAPEGEYLVYEDMQPTVLAILSGQVLPTAPEMGEIMIMPVQLKMTVHGTIMELDTKLVKAGKLILGDGPVGPPPPPPPPVTISSDGRMNLGLYGGSVLDMAYDDVHDIVIAAVSAPQSVFISSDSGLTWMPAFSNDSLEYYEGQTTRGFGGRGVQVESSGGYSYSLTSQEAGTLTGSQVSTDGVNWRTLLDPYLVGKLLEGNFPGQAGGQYAVQALSARGPVALVGAMNYVFRTTDAGQTWDISVVPTPTSHNINQSIGALELRRDDPSGKSFYVTLGEGYRGGQAQALYYTEDGQTFTPVYIISGSDTVGAIQSIVTHPYQSDTLWVGAVDEFNPSLSGLWRSYDGGTTWDLIFQADNPHNSPAVTLYEDSNYPGPDNIRLFLVGFDKYSDDLGDTWDEFDPQNDPYIDRVSNARAAIGHIKDTDIYFAMGDGAPSRSTAGLNGYYLFVPTGIEGITIWDIAQVPNNLDKVYLATSVGIAYTSAFTDTSLTSTEKWVSPYGNYPINPQNGGNMGFTAITIDPYNTSHIIAANGNAIFTSTTGGTSNSDWQAVSYEEITGFNTSEFKGMGGKVEQISFITSDSVIAAVRCEHSNYGALLLSTDGGYSWATMPQAGEHSFRTVIAAWNAARDSMVLFAGGGGIFEDPFTHSDIIDSGAVYKSTDWGATWTRTALAPYGVFNPATFPLPINEMAAKPGSLDTLYMACGDNLSNAIVRSFDGGNTLESLDMETVGMFEGAFEAVAINKNNPDSVYFAVRRDILVYDAAANQTTRLFRGYPGELTHTLLYDELTMGSSAGFYQITTSGNSPTQLATSEVERPTQVTLKQNYPNPFNPSTIIQFTLPEAGKVQLDVFNVLGQRVTTLISEPRKAGTHTVHWQADKLSSGIYFYRLQVVFANGTKHTFTRKLMVVK